MQEYKWVADCGSCSKEGLREILEKSKNSETQYYIAMMTDGFLSGIFSGNIIGAMLSDKLLELRVFNEESELLATRGSVGANFGWRITTDQSLGEKDYIISKQFIDINEKLPSSVLENGNRVLWTTGGGKYSLPIDDQRRVVVKSYIFYDSNGMAKVIDSRVCSFTK